MIYIRAQIELKSKRSSGQRIWALPALALALALIALLFRINSEGAYPTLFGLLFGYILQRSRFCFAGGFRDIFMIRNTTITRAILLALLLTGAGFALIYRLTEGAVRLNISPLGLHTLAGGLAFGFGMVIAGSCVSGCLVRLGEGYLTQWLTMAGLLIGSAAGAWHLGWWYNFSIVRSPVAFLPAYLGWQNALLLQSAAIAALYYLAYRYEGGRRGAPPRQERLHGWKSISPAAAAAWLKRVATARSWPYAAGAAGLALVNTLLLYFWGRPWGITGGLTHLSGWLGAQAGLNPFAWHYFQNLLPAESSRVFLQYPLIYLAAAMTAGSLISSLLHREFRIRKPRSGKYLLSALAGGVLMGYGSRAALGCNIGGLLSGIGSLSLHGWVFGLAVLGGAYLGGKFFLRTLL